MVEKIVPGFDDSDMNKLFDEMYESSTPPPGGFISRNFADHRGISISKARQILDEQVRQGKLEKKGLYPGPTGGSTYYYYKL